LGDRKLLELAIALAAEPELLLLDEPSEGLAPVIVDALVETRQRLRVEGLALLLAEQNLRVALALADAVYVIEKKGQIVHQVSAAAFAQDEATRRRYLGV
jgi:branched-chain amino acid transport system ATP-binding protein